MRSMPLRPFSGTLKRATMSLSCWAVAARSWAWESICLTLMATSSAEATTSSVDALFSSATAAAAAAACAANGSQQALFFDLVGDHARRDSLGDFSRHAPIPKPRHEG